MPNEPFDLTGNEASMRLLPPDQLPLLSTANYLLPIWDENDALALTYGAWLGTFGLDKEGQRQQQEFLAKGSSIQMTPETDLVSLLETYTPIRATGNRVTYTGNALGVGLFALKNDPTHLAQFWNYRACGGLAYPIPIDEEARFSAGAEQWLSASTTRLAASTSRINTTPKKYINIFSEDADCAERLSDLVHRTGYEVRINDPQHTNGWFGAHPLQTSFEMPFTIQTDKKVNAIDIPLPRLTLRSDQHRPGAVAFDIDFFKETGFAPGQTFSAPSLRKLSDRLHQDWRLHEPIHRASGSGRVVVAQASETSISVQPLHSFTIFEDTLGTEGCTLDWSDEGRFGTQLVEKLGGVGATTANQPAIKSVLREIGSSPKSLPLPRLLQAAQNGQGIWPNSLTGITPKEYPKAVVATLLQNRLLQARLEVKCPSCRTALEIRPEDIQSNVKCEFCEVEIPLGIALMVTGHGTPWRYDLAANVPFGRLAATLPVMATLSVLKTFRASSNASLPCILGLTVKRGLLECEIDIAAVIADGPDTLFVLGEVKGGKDEFTDEDIEHLEAVQTLLRNSGIEAILLFATTRPTGLSANEKHRLRHLCERAPRRLAAIDGGFRVEATQMLPVILLEEDLSVPWTDSRHPLHWTKPGEPPLAGMAYRSCQEHLGLKTFQVNHMENKITPLFEPPTSHAPHTNGLADVFST